MRHIYSTIFPLLLTFFFLLICSFLHGLNTSTLTNTCIQMFYPNLCSVFVFNHQCFGFNKRCVCVLKFRLISFSFFNDRAKFVYPRLYFLLCFLTDFIVLTNVFISVILLELIFIQYDTEVEVIFFFMYQILREYFLICAKHSSKCFSDITLIPIENLSDIDILINFIFKVFFFWFTAQLSGRYRYTIYLFLTSNHLPLPTSTPEWHISYPWIHFAYDYHPMPIVYIQDYSWCSICYEFRQMCNWSSQNNHWSPRRKGKW